MQNACTKLQSRTEPLASRVKGREPAPNPQKSIPLPSNLESGGHHTLRCESLGSDSCPPHSLTCFLRAGSKGFILFEAPLSDLPPTSAFASAFLLQTSPPDTAHRHTLFPPSPLFHPLHSHVAQASLELTVWSKRTSSSYLPSGSRWV